MSEKLRSSEKNIENTDSGSNTLSSKKLAESLKRGSESSHEHQRNINAIHKNIEQNSVSREAVAVNTEASDPTPIHTLHKDLRDLSFDRTMISIRKKLTPRQRLVSSVIHKPTVEKTSEFVSKTFARPIGMSLGAIFMAVSSTILLLASKHYGFSYNYALVAITLVIGYMFGLLVELLLRASKAIKKV